MIALSPGDITSTSRVKPHRLSILLAWLASAARRRWQVLFITLAVVPLVFFGAWAHAGSFTTLRASHVPQSLCLPIAALQRLVPPRLSPSPSAAEAVVSADAGIASSETAACCVGEGASAFCWQPLPQAARLRLFFMSNQLGPRGSEIALFDYAAAFEAQACGLAFILAPAARTDAKVAAKFSARFPGRVLALAGGCNGNAATDAVACTAAVASVLAEHGAHYIYATDYGTRLFWQPPPGVTVLAHGIFDGRGTPWPGTVPAVISDSVYRARGIPVVPYMVDWAAPATSGPTLRNELGITADATVFCRHGGDSTFDVPLARDGVCQFARRNAMSTILLLNTAPHACERGIGNIIHLPAIIDLREKARFLAACNACVHGRLHGETFGLAVAECSLAGLPVLTYGIADPDQDFHLRVLGPYARRYTTAAELVDLMQGFDAASAKALAPVYANLYADYSPRQVMLTFLHSFGLLAAVIQGEAR